MDKAGNVDIFLRLIGDLGLDETVLIEGAENTGEIADRTEETIENSAKTGIDKTIPNRHPHTNRPNRTLHMQLHSHKYIPIQTFR